MTQKEIEKKFLELGYTKTNHTDDFIVYDDLSIDGTPSRFIKPYYSGDNFRECINHDKYIEFNKLDKSIYTGEDVGVISKELEDIIQEQSNLFFNIEIDEGEK